MSAAGFPARHASGDRDSTVSNPSANFITAKNRRILNRYGGFLWSRVRESNPPPRLGKLMPIFFYQS